jgi:hypothetical protein
VTTSRRYVLSDESRRFLDAVASSIEKRKRVINPGETIFRAQIGHDLAKFEHDFGEGFEAVPFTESRMKPQRGRAAEGRANPRGIAVLYCAFDESTAIAEVRPWVGAVLSVAPFTPSLPVTIVDCTRNFMGASFKLDYLFSGLSDLEQDNLECPETHAWHDMDAAFSAPVKRDEHLAEYAPTQILAELFKAHGLDGVAYRSAVSKNGLNIAIFDPEKVHMLPGKVVRVKEVCIRTDESRIECADPDRAWDADDCF